MGTKMNMQTVYINCKVCYNFSVKKLIAILICLISALCLTCGTVSALAYTAAPYPEEFEAALTFSALCDFAVGGDGSYAFLHSEGESKVITVYSDSEIEEYSPENVAAIDYDGEKYVYSDGENVFSLPDLQPCESVMQGFAQSLDIGNGDYNYRFVDGKFIVTDYTDAENLVAPKTFSGEYTALKAYSGKAFAIKENVLYSFTGTEETAVSLTYFDYDRADNMVSQEVYGNLKACNGVKFAEIAWVTKPR